MPENSKYSKVSSDIYWASAPADAIAHECLAKISDYYQFLQLSGLKRRWIDTYSYYYRGAVTSGELLPSGEQGELTEITVNHFRSILQHLVSIITKQDLAFECRAVNSDRKSLSQTIIGNGLLNYYLMHGSLKDIRFSAVELAILHGDAFVELSWDAAAGETIGVDVPDMVEEGVDPMTKASPVREGDPVIRALSPVDVVRDFTASDADAEQWFIVRDFKSRWDLMAKYAVLLPDGTYKDPELAEKIRTIGVPWGSPENFKMGYNSPNFRSDRVPMWRLLHAKCPSMPDGRLVEFVGEDIVLSDSPFPYEDMSIYRISVSNQVGTAMGYTIAEDLKPVQKAMDGCDSTVISNLANFGVANLLSKKGSGLTLEQMSGASNFVQYEGDAEPKFMQPVPIPPVAMEYRAQLKNDQEQISAVNATMRGEPPPQVQSGAFGALLANQALEFASNLQHSDAMLMQHIGIGLLRMFRRFVTTPKMAKIAGKSAKSMMTQFTGDDLSEIDRVEVDLGNPLLRTMSGRAQIAEDLLTKGMITDGKQYLMFLQTGKLEPMFEHETSRLMLIRAENEWLSDGKPVQALITDPHPEHIKEHLTQLDSPELREPTPENLAVIQNVLNHVLEHKFLWTQMEPVMLQAVGIPPPPQPMMPQMAPPMVPPGGPGNAAPQGPPGPPQGPQGPPAGPPPPSAGFGPPRTAFGPPPGQEVPGPKLPSLPKDPLTGQQVQPAMPPQ